MKEFDDNGLNGLFSLFWNVFQDLVMNLENMGVCLVLQEQGKFFVESFNYIFILLINIQGDIKKNLDNIVDQVNLIFNQLNDFNI